MGISFTRVFPTSSTPQTFLLTILKNEEFILKSATACPVMKEHAATNTIYWLEYCNNVF